MTDFGPFSFWKGMVALCEDVMALKGIDLGGYGCPCGNVAMKP